MIRKDHAPPPRTQYSRGGEQEPDSLHQFYTLVKSLLYLLIILFGIIFGTYIGILSPILSEGDKFYIKIIQLFEEKSNNILHAFNKNE